MSGYSANLHASDAAGANAREETRVLKDFAATNQSIVGRSAMLLRQQREVTGERINRDQTNTSQPHCARFPNDDDTTCYCIKADNAWIAQRSRNNQRVGGTLRIAGNTLAGVIVAFFPKCPVCWAGYMSLFGAVGLRSIHYTPQVLCLFIADMAANLYLHYRISRKNNRMAAFILNLTGVAAVILGYLSGATLFTYVGLTLLISSSLFINLQRSCARKLATDQSHRIADLAN